jgi:hypothetical protein
MPNWSKIIAGLNKLIDEVGNGLGFWPKSTPLAGYAEDGPYHCEDCSFLKGKKEGNIFVDSNGKGRCPHPVMLADKKTKKDKDGFAIVNINKGCCEFVDQIPDKPGEPEGLVQISGVQMKKHPYSHTVIEHHDDGSHTVHHIHKKHGYVHNTPAREGDVRGAAADHDGMLDHMIDHTSDANMGEDQNAEQVPLAAGGKLPGQVA